MLESNGNQFPESKGSKIGTWCSAQRSLYKQGKLLETQIQRLESINFPWDVCDFDQKWDGHFNNFKILILKDKSFLFQIKDNPFGKWINQQRFKYRNGKLSPRRINLLNSIDFIWDQKEFEWQQFFNEYKKSLLDNSNKLDSGRTPLSEWIIRQRSLYHKGKLSQEKLDLFNSINFSWDPNDDEWQEKIKQLMQFKSEHGHASPPRAHSSLGTWVSSVRQRYKKGKLSIERVNQLKHIDFKWTIK